MSAIPSFLRPSSPPRSPHGPSQGSTASTFPFPGMRSTSPSAPTTRRASFGASGVIGMLFRPNRRDIMTVLVTLFCAWLLFGATPTEQYEYDHELVLPGQEGAALQGAALVAAAADREKQEKKKNRYLAGGFSLPKLGNWRGAGSNGGGLQDLRMGSGAVMEPVCETTAKVVVKPERGYSESVKAVDSLLATSDARDDIDEDDDAGVTSMLGHMPGWTIFKNLYLYDGSLYVVTTKRSDYPELRLLTSTGLPANGDPGNEASREPKGDELKFITPQEAAELWEGRVWEMDGMTWLFNDGQFIDHYYHWAAELFLGVWRTYASLAKDFTPKGETGLPPPKRAWFIRHTEQTWRDGPRFNPAILWSAFPSISVLYQDDWKDIKRATSSGLPKAYIFPKAILCDRSAAFRGHTCPATARTVAEAVQIGEPGRWWWEPVRRQILRFAGTPEEILDRNLEGYGAVNPAMLDANGGLMKESLGRPVKAIDLTIKPLVTYISRQGSRRRLTAECHEELVAALEKHSKANGWELMVVQAEKLSKEEQLNLAARTTIMLGVHGNGLTHLLWMPATPRSAVIEMFYAKGEDKGFARDYQWTAQNLGIRHFAMQHDTYHTAPNEPKVDYPEGFQGTEITVVGEVVAQLIDDRLAMKL